MIDIHRHDNISIGSGVQPLDCRDAFRMPIILNLFTVSLNVCAFSDSLRLELELHGRNQSNALTHLPFRRTEVPN